MARMPLTPATALQRWLGTRQLEENSAAADARSTQQLASCSHSAGTSRMILNRRGAYAQYTAACAYSHSAGTSRMTLYRRGAGSRLQVSWPGGSAAARLARTWGQGVGCGVGGVRMRGSTSSGA